jgi:hypothetical protein
LHKFKTNDQNIKKKKDVETRAEIEVHQGKIEQI